LNTTQDSLENAISSNDTDIATLNTTQDSLENAISSNDTELDSIFARADSIINVLYWNNNAGVLSHDAGIDSVDVDGVLQVNGNSDLNGDLDASGAASIGGALDVTGVTTMSDSLNGTTADLSSDLDVDGNSTLDSTVVNEYFEATVDSFDMNSSKNGSISASDSLLVSAQVAATMAMEAITYADFIVDSAATISATISPVMLQESSVSGDVSTEFSVDWVHSGVAFGDDLDALDNAVDAVMTGGTLTEAGWISEAQGAGSMFYDAGTEYNAVIYADDTLKLITDTDGLVSITSDSTQVNSKLNVAEDADFDANVNIDGNSYTDGNADIDGTLDVNGNTDLDTTDIDGSLNVEDMATFQANVQINDSLNVTNDAHIGGDFQVDGDSDLDGTLDVDGDTEMDTVNVDGSLTVAQFADFNDSLDVALSVNIQDNLDVNDSLRLNSAQNEGRILTVTDSQGGLGVTIETVNTSGSTSATTLTTHRLVVQDDAVYNGDLNVNGALAVTSNITSAAAPTSPNHITNKEYVDTRIAQAITPPQIWDYEAVGSTTNDTIFFINGDLLLYATEEDTQENYQLKFYGSDLDLTGDNAPETIQLRARGNVLNLNNSVNDVNFWSSGTGGTFNIGYTDIKALAGGQEDGYVSTTLTFVNVGGQEYTTGVVIRFYLDSENDAETGATFIIED
jgi:cytoskeletal protein CcmA (bactofilin family)